MKNFDAYVDFICNQITNRNKNQLTNEELDGLISFLESALTNPIMRPIILGEDTGEIKLTNDDKINIKKKIQTIFNIKMDHCIVIEGEEQRKRDKSWWTKDKVNNELLYWKLYKNGLKLPPKVKVTIDDDTDVILNNLFNPKEKIPTSRYGMVVGHVQSGKTSNYAGLLCKAADAGYRCFIIIAGIHNNLRTQTQKRIKNIFSKIGNAHEPIFLTTDDFDFNTKDVQKFATLNFENCSKPIFLVIKKNTNTLKSVISWLNTKYQDKINVPLLLIDDEADNASINTKVQEDPTMINKRIRELLQKFNQYSYVGYTATPFANIFIDDLASNDGFGKDLFPDDFIITLNAPDNYYGAERIFLQHYNGIELVEDFDDYVHIQNRSNFEMEELPPSLEEAIRCFYLNIAIRNLRNDEKHNSMLIHAAHLTSAHQTIAYHVEEYNSEIQHAIKIYGKLNSTKNYYLNSLKETFDEKYDSEFTWQEILEKLNDIYSTIEIIQEHSLSKFRIEYHAGEYRNIIAIGGNSLSRGFTLEGLTVSYFTRSAKAYDTLMQMARWFGYRDGYADVCKIFITDEIYQNFVKVSEATADLFSDLNEMRLKNKTPKDFGLSVKKHPGTFLITARNKMKSTEDFTLEYRLDGLTKETNLLPANIEELKSNLTVTKDFLLQLYSYKDPIEEDKNKYLWLDIPTSDIRNYFERFNFARFDYDHFPVSSIKEFLTSYPNKKWRVLLYGTNNEPYKISENLSVGIQERVVKYVNKDTPLSSDFNLISIGSRSQVSGGNAEQYGLLNKEFDEIKKKLEEEGEDITRTNIKRHLKQPLVIIHYIKPAKKNDTPQEILNNIFVALSFCFPKTDSIACSTVTITANSVYIRQMKQMDLFMDDWIDNDD